jgi:hypothetical protein
MTTEYLYDWQVETLLPLQDEGLKRFAIRSWTRKLLEISGKKPLNFLGKHFHVPISGGTTESFKRWHREGYPDPKVFLNDGSAGRPLTLDEEYPGSFRTLFHPAWVILSGPKSIDSCRRLIFKLDEPISSELSHRHFREAPGFTTYRRSGIVALLGDFYCHSYVIWLQKVGTFEAFIGALSISIEYYLHIVGKPSVEKPTFVEVFSFDPNEWSFTKSIHADDLVMLVKRIDVLNRAYLNPTIENAMTDEMSILKLHLKKAVKVAQLEKLELQVKTALNNRDKDRKTFALDV